MLKWIFSTPRRTLLHVMQPMINWTSTTIRSDLMRWPFNVFTLTQLRVIKTDCSRFDSEQRYKSWPSNLAVTLGVFDTATAYMYM